MSHLYFQLYNPCGLFNQVTSLELAVGLSHELNKKLVIHNVSNPPNGDYNGSRVPIYSANYAFNDRGGLVDTGIYPNISDLMVWANKDETVLINDIVDYFTKEDIRVEDLMGFYFSNSETLSSNEEYFSEGRKRIDVKSNQSVHLRKTLGYYSRFFYNRSRSLDQAIGSVRFKPEYYELSKVISKSIGNFNGAHLRLTDHVIRANTQLEEFDRGLDSLSGKLPIVLCTDQATSDVVKNSSHNFILLDKYILENFYREFRSLDFKEEVSFGIINNLVMHYSKDFIGTSGSTFSGYIHRGINQKREYDWKIFGIEEHSKTGPYSWNGHFQDTITKQWWREWKESRLDI